LEKLDSVKILRKCAELGIQSKIWKKKKGKGDKCESIVYKALTNIGYQINAFEMLDEGDISVQRKIEKLKESRFPDAFTRYIGEDEPLFEPCFFLDAKFKTLEKHLGVVNKNDYDGYVKFLRNFTVLTPFKIMFCLDNVEEIWIHNLRNPDDDPNLNSTLCILRRSEVYRIPLSELTLWERALYNE